MGDATRLVAICVLVTSGCVVADDEPALDVDEIELGCTTGDDATVYTPYPGSASYPSGPALDHPWHAETFESYGPALPVSVECASTKGRQSHLEVTAGCLDAVVVSGRYQRGVVRGNTAGAFRALALGHTAGDSIHPIKWTDQGIEYRFHYRAATGTSGNPGFKAFARYRTEHDLYVASWRLDGVVQIQRKLCGSYTTLAVIPDFGAPSPGVWHWVRFEAIGDQLDLYLDDELVLSTSSGSFGWGTVGIRIDSVDGAFIDDWSLVP